MKQSTIFFGSSSYVLPVIDMLSKKYDLKLVVTTEKNPTDPVVTFCNANHIPYLSVTTLSNPKVNHQLSIIHTQFAVLAHFGLIVPQSVIDLFPKGIINIHPSLLPAYRGPTPGTTAILNGDKTTGVSIMLLDKDVDHGPILGQEKENILPTDTSVTLYERLFQKGTQLLEKVLPAYLDGSLQPKEQDHTKATFTEHLTRESGFLDLEKIQKMSPLEIGNWKLEIARKVRAFYPWPGVWTSARIKNQAFVPSSGRGELRIKLLPEKLVQVEGKKPMSYKDFMNGYPEGKDLLMQLGLL